MKAHLLAASLCLAMATPVFAGDMPVSEELASLNRVRSVGMRAASLASQPWMSPDVSGAWRMGYTGQGTTITDVDSFTGNQKFGGNLDGVSKNQRHGEWTREQLALIAPSANIRSIDLPTSSKRIDLAKSGLNVINASYGIFANSGASLYQICFNDLQRSLISHARSGAAVVVKAAGNYAVAVDGSIQGKTDYLNLALKGAHSAIYVGALSSNGSAAKKATLASYSNYAGANATIQNQFLVVGVEGNKTGLYGTSFAAPVVAGYAAIVGSKFTSAKPSQIANQLLKTARTDTIANYDKSVHGRGEASLSRALAPRSIR